ncbi:restriction endonuclease subunit S [Oceanobacillus zhaokaii]|uniref:Restriction endonuclease subunit S n=1 Tax=Oceanobacillus zhaokaii TaxID=2052660 RepID=A0A345PEK9_9BACI|nr:restriction endonuclease subunit S [Oceanobacillus zhaokaii]AXI08439.1 restriction endonuclease subunit S [Oceanobacillus zhaokaii]
MTSNKPEIHFDGFTNEWKQRKLGDISENFEYGLNASATEYDGENKYIRITDIDDNSHKFLMDEVTSPDTDLSIADNYLLEEGDILFARTGASVGKTYLYDAHDGKVYYAGFLIRARVKPEYDSQFVFQNTLTSNYNNFVKITSQRSGQPGINAQEYASFSILMPEKEEQIKIGNFFKQLDNAIALYKCKHEKLINYKNAMLQKLLPQNGKMVPEIRFNGFTDDWKQLKLGEHSDIKAGGTPKTDISEYWFPKEIPWMSSGEVNKKRLFNTDNQISKTGLENSSARWIKEKSILIALAGQGKTRGTVAINEIPLTTNQSIAAIEVHSNLDSEFVLQNLESRYEELRKLSSGDGTRGGLNKQLIANLNIVAPSVEEQKKIGMLFKQLDNTISLQQEQLNKLQKIKKSMLQKMLV